MPSLAITRDHMTSGSTARSRCTASLLSLKGNIQETMAETSSFLGWKLRQEQETFYSIFSKGYGKSFLFLP
jgi:hypothetical protein